MEHHNEPPDPATGAPHIERSNSSSSSSASSDTNIRDHHQQPQSQPPSIHAPVPTRPKLPSRQSSGPMIVPRDSSDVGPVESHYGPDDVRAMSPRRTSEDIEALGREAREELRRYVIPDPGIWALARADGSRRDADG